MKIGVQNNKTSRVSLDHLLIHYVFFLSQYSNNVISFPCYAMYIKECLSEQGEALTLNNVFCHYNKVKPQQ